MYTESQAVRMLSKNGNRLKRFESLLDTLPAGYVFDGEIVALDDGGRPVFNDLMFAAARRFMSRSI
jgi:ATP-dependent DNA ligase